MCLTHTIRTLTVPPDKPLIGFRAFEVAENKIFSGPTLVGTYFHLTPVYKSFYGTWLPKGVYRADIRPRASNNNGLHMFRTWTDLMAQYSTCAVAGEIAVWGHCVEHSNGFRAQFARIRKLYLHEKYVAHTYGTALWGGDGLDIALDLYLLYGVEVYPILSSKQPLQRYGMNVHTFRSWTDY